MLITHPVLKSMETEKKAYSESRTGTQARSSRQVSHVLNFDAFVNPQELEATADRWMFDGTIVGDIFHLRVRDAAVSVKEGR
jgi:hypothetical protein